MKWALLPCNGMDKPEGALAREVGMQVAEATAGEIVCPVLLNRAVARYKDALASATLVVIDGCGTRCASKLATQVGVKPGRKVVISALVKALGAPLGPSLRLEPGEVALAASIATEVVSALTAETGEVAPPVAWDLPGDYLVVPYEQFQFRVPKEGYLFSENDAWVRVAGTRARVGLSDYLQQNLTDIYYFDPPAVGAVVEQFGELGSVESSKAIFEIVAPLSGTVLSENQVLVEKPELINVDPYGEGWLVEVELTATWPEERQFLLDGAAYLETLAGKAADGGVAKER